MCQHDPVVRSADWDWGVGPLFLAVLYGLLAGAAIPAGGALAHIEHIRPKWLEQELRHTIIAFGGGVLLAAVALVLVPEGMLALAPVPAILLFAAGGLVFCFVDLMLKRQGGSVSQLLAMVMDFVPESLALGATLATEEAVGMLLALLIALQNLPEGFNAYRELRASGRLSPATVLAVFAGLALLGPLAAWLGFAYLQDETELLGGIMLFASGGILYLLFEDIAPQVPLEQRWAPPLGALGGFGLGMAGQALL
jgi:zinc transporter, ZIP family